MFKGTCISTLILFLSAFASAGTLSVSDFTYEVSSEKDGYSYNTTHQLGEDEAGLFYTTTVKIDGQTFPNSKKNRLSAEEINRASSYFDFCSNPGIDGKIESINIKAGSFTACRSVQTLSNDSSFEYTTWYIKGFWLPIKSIMKMSNGQTQMQELTELNIHK